MEQEPPDDLSLERSNDEHPTARPVTRGRGHRGPTEEKPRRVVFVDHHHVHHHHHFHAPTDWDGAPGDLPPESLQRCQEQKAEQDVERCMGQTGPAPAAPPPLPKQGRPRPRRNAPGRWEPVGGASIDLLEESLAGSLPGLQSTFSTFGARGGTAEAGLPSAEASWLASVSNPLPATNSAAQTLARSECRRKQPPELQLQQYFEVMSCLPLETRLKLSPYAACPAPTQSLFVFVGVDSDCEGLGLTLIEDLSKRLGSSRRLRRNFKGAEVRLSRLTNGGWAVPECEALIPLVTPQWLLTPAGVAALRTVFRLRAMHLGPKLLPVVHLASFGDEPDALSRALNAPSGQLLREAATTWGCLSSCTDAALEDTAVWAAGRLELLFAPLPTGSTESLPEEGELEEENPPAPVQPENPFRKSADASGLTQATWRRSNNVVPLAAHIEGEVPGAVWQANPNMDGVKSPMRPANMPSLRPAAGAHPASEDPDDATSRLVTGDKASKLLRQAAQSSARQVAEDQAALQPRPRRASEPAIEVVANKRVGFQAGQTHTKDWAEAMRNALGVPDDQGSYHEGAARSSSKKQSKDEPQPGPELPTTGDPVAPVPSQLEHRTKTSIPIPPLPRAASASANFGVDALDVTSCVAAVLGAAAAFQRRRSSGVARNAVLLDATVDAACFDGSSTAAVDPRDSWLFTVVFPQGWPCGRIEKELPQKADADAPPRGSRSLDELPYLIGNPFVRRLAVSSRVTGEFAAAPARVWAMLTGAEGDWRDGRNTRQLKVPSVGDLVLTCQTKTVSHLEECYGIPWPLQLQDVTGGSLQSDAEICGLVGAFGQEVRRFRWKVLKADFTEATGQLEMLGSVDGEDNSFMHTIRVSAAASGSGAIVVSEIRYAPSPPLQTLLNALGGRRSQTASHTSVLRRLAVLVDGDVDFDSTAFYNLIGRLIDLVAPFEDGARAAVARMAGLGKGEASILELGCGSGRWAQGIYDNSSGVLRYLGVDSSSTMAEEAARAMSKIPAASIVQADARRPGTLKEACETMLGGDSVAATEDYLDNYFEKNLAAERLLSSTVRTYFYAIAAKAPTSRWFDELIKVNAQTRSVEHAWSAPSIYLTEADFIPFMEVWETVWQNQPSVVGGCRPKDLAAKLRSFGWDIVDTEVTDVLGYRSQATGHARRLQPWRPKTLVEAGVEELIPGLEEAITMNQGQYWAAVLCVPILRVHALREYQAQLLPDQVPEPRPRTPGRFADVAQTAPTTPNGRQEDWDHFDLQGTGFYYAEVMSPSALRMTNAGSSASWNWKQTSYSWDPTETWWGAHPAETYHSIPGASGSREGFDDADLDKEAQAAEAGAGEGGEGQSATVLVASPFLPLVRGTKLGAICGREMFDKKVYH
eukprot:s1666_g9.t1